MLFQVTILLVGERASAYIAGNTFDAHIEAVCQRNKKKFSLDISVKNDYIGDEYDSSTGSETDWDSDPDVSDDGLETQEEWEENL